MSNSNYNVVFSAMKDYSTLMESIIKLLIDTCNDINCKDNNGKTIMELAIENREVNIVKMLLKKGFNCNIKDNNGIYLLYKAFELRTGDNEILYLLINSKGIDLEILDGGNSILEYAISNNEVNIVEQLLKYRGDCSDVLEHTLQHCNNNKIIITIINKSKTINSWILRYIFGYINLNNIHTDCDICECDIMTYNKYIDRNEIIEKLIDRGVDAFDGEFIDDAIRLERVDALKLISAYGWDKKSLNMYGITRLDTAISYGSLSVIKFLEENCDK